MMRPHFTFWAALGLLFRCGSPPSPTVCQSVDAGATGEPRAAVIAVSIRWWHEGSECFVTRLMSPEEASEVAARYPQCAVFEGADTTDISCLDSYGRPADTSECEWAPPVGKHP